MKSKQAANAKPCTDLSKDLLCKDEETILRVSYIVFILLHSIRSFSKPLA